MILPLRRHVRARAVASALVVAMTFVLQAGAAQALIISEVMFNPNGFFGNDDGDEYVELFNDGPNSVLLDAYSLGWGGADYTFGSFALTNAGWLDPGEYIVVGNTGSGFDFDPNLPDGFWVAGAVGLFVGTDTSGTPFDAVIYTHIFGGNANGLVDETGNVGAVDATTGAAGQSIERQVAGGWAPTATPTPGTGLLVPEPSTAMLLASGLLLMGARRRR